MSVVATTADGDGVRMEGEGGEQTIKVWTARVESRAHLKQSCKCLGDEVPVPLGPRSKGLLSSVTGLTFSVKCRAV